MSGNCTGPVTVLNRRNLLIIADATPLVGPDVCVKPGSANSLPVVRGNGVDPTIRVTGGQDVFVSQLNVVEGGDGVEYDFSTTSATSPFRTVTCSCLGPNTRSGLEVESSTGISALRNLAISNRNDGIFFNETVNGFVSMNEAHHNHDRGIQVIRGATDVIENNNAHENDDDGIKLAATDSRCQNNTSNANLGDGIDIRHGARNLIDQNTANGNGGAGVRLSLTNRATVTNNVAMRNGIPEMLVEGVKSSFINGNAIPNAFPSPTNRFVICSGGNSANTGNNLPSPCQ